MKWRGGFKTFVIILKLGEGEENNLIPRDESTYLQALKKKKKIGSTFPCLLVFKQAIV